TRKAPTSNNRPRMRPPPAPACQRKSRKPKPTRSSRNKPSTRRKRSFRAVSNSSSKARCHEKNSTSRESTSLLRVTRAQSPNSTTVEIWLEAKNPKHALKPGTSVQLSLTAQTVKDALVVPASAIVTTPDGATVVMVAGTDSVAHQTPVKVGIRNGDDAQILE